MSQILWLWNLLPMSVVTAIINILIIVGILGVCSAWIGRWIPFFSAYAPTLKLIGVVCLVAGMYFKGGASVEATWRQRVADLEQQVKLAEERAETANAKIETVYVDRVQVVTDVKYVVQNSIRKSANKFDMMCKIDPQVITILNESARQPVKDKK